jgi:hypothetical protein
VSTCATATRPQRQRSSPCVGRQKSASTTHRARGDHAAHRPANRSADASRHIRALADEKLPHIEALIARAQGVKHWLQVAQSCDCTSVDVCGLFVDPTLLPPAGDVDLDVRQIRSRGRA